MLSHEEYNMTFDVDLSEEEFNELMNNPIEICFETIDAIESIIMADHNGNKREFIPKKCGEWVKTYRGCYICSVCKNFAIDYDDTQYLLTDFCPSCGADMRGLNNEN